MILVATPWIVVCIGYSFIKESLSKLAQLAKFGGRHEEAVAMDRDNTT